MKRNESLWRKMKCARVIFFATAATTNSLSFARNVSVSNVSCIVRLCVFAQSFNYLMSVMVFFSMYCIRFPLAVHCMPVGLNLMPVLFLFSTLCFAISPVFFSFRSVVQKLQFLLYLITHTLTHRLLSLIFIL